MSENREYKYKWYLFGCKDAGYLHEKKHDTGLSFSEKILYYFHLATCHLCRKYVAQLGLIMKNIQQILDEIKLEKVEKNKIHNKIKEKLS